MCQHPRVRCIHGDETNQAMTMLDAILNRPYRRARCVDCGKALPRSLPQVCSDTGVAHGTGIDR